jgi:hypothetical protein
VPDQKLLAKLGDQNCPGNNTLEKWLWRVG